MIEYIEELINTYEDQLEIAEVQLEENGYDRVWLREKYKAKDRLYILYQIKNKWYKTHST